jgi:1-phosphofructokinase family hexose kinase
VLVVNPGQEETVINEEGPTVDADGRRLLMDAVRAGLRHAHIMVLAGSLPPGLPDDFYAQAIGLARARRIRVLLDASGAPLRQGLAARPDFVKVNRAELAGATGRSLTSLDDVVAGAEDLVEALGCQVVVTMGPDGAALVTREGRWHLAPPPVQRMSTIGAGDSLTAGLVVGLMRGLPLREAAMIGIAAAAADVTSLLPGTIDAAQVETLRSGVTVHTLEGEAT